MLCKCHSGPHCVLKSAICTATLTYCRRRRGDGAQSALHVFIFFAVSVRIHKYIQEATSTRMLPVQNDTRKRKGTECWFNKHLFCRVVLPHPLMKGVTAIVLQKVVGSSVEKRPRQNGNERSGKNRVLQSPDETVRPDCLLLLFLHLVRTFVYLFVMMCMYPCPLTMLAMSPCLFVSSVIHRKPSWCGKRSIQRTLSYLAIVRCIIPCLTRK